MEHDPVSQVLMNDDLLWIIFELVKVQPGGRLADLSSFPRVCQAFRGPATGVIWSELDGMMPLWHLLAPTKRRPYGYYAYTRLVDKHLRSIISAKQYDIPQIMSRFLCLQAQLSQIVLQRSGDKGVLTGLRAIRCTVSSLNHIETYILRLSTSALLDLSIYIDDSLPTRLPGTWIEERNATPESIPEVLDNLSQNSPDLTSIWLNLMLDDALTTILLRFPRLTAIRQIEVGTTTTFTLLVTKLGLTSLDVRWKGPPDSAHHLPRTVLCPSLIELSLHGPCAALTPLLTSLSAPALRRFAVELKAESPEDWQAASHELRPADPKYPDCMKALVAAVPELEELLLTIPQPWEISYGDLLAPILHLRGIRRFIYNLCVDSSRHTATDGDLMAVARAWRALEVFRIEPIPSLGHPDSRPAPSVAALAHFRTWCPNLVELIPPPLNPNSEPPDLEDLTSEAAVPPLTKPAHQLQMLVVQLQGMEWEDMTAARQARWRAYISRLFPHLLPSSVASMDSALGEPLDPWGNPRFSNLVSRWVWDPVDSESSDE